MKQYFFLASILFAACSGGAKQSQGDAKVYSVITVSEQNNVSQASYPANIEGVVNSPVQARVSGYITQVLVDEGQAVKQGQALFRLETQALTQSAEAAKAAVNAAQVEVNKLLPLVEKNIVSKVQLETAQANLQRAKAAHNEVLANIGYSVVRAPVSGVVGSINFREGALVTAGSTVLTTVSDVKEVYAYFSMNEKDYLDFLEQYEGVSLAEKLNNMPEVSLVLANGTTYKHKGKIRAVTGQIDAATGSMQFRATFANPESTLTNGNSGTIVIPQLHSHALVIPEMATFEQQGVSFAYRVVNDTIKQSVVEIARRSNNLVVVANGLSVGDVVIVEGLSSVHSGMAVKTREVSMDSIVNAIQPIF